MATYPTNRTVCRRVAIHGELFITELHDTLFYTANHSLTIPATARLSDMLYTNS